MEETEQPEDDLVSVAIAMGLSESTIDQLTTLQASKKRDWNPRSWVVSPQTLLDDFTSLRDEFSSLYQFAPDVGSHFTEDKLAQALWCISLSDFAVSLRAAQAIKSLPVSTAALNRVTGIIKNYGAIDEKRVELIDADGQKTFRSTWHDRHDFLEQVRLCEEAIQILRDEQTAVRKFVDLVKSGEDVDPNRATEILAQPDDDEFVGYFEIALRLTNAGHEIAANTIRNNSRNLFGECDRKVGNANVFSWNRIKPILEDKYSVKL